MDSSTTNDSSVSLHPPLSSTSSPSPTQPSLEEVLLLTSIIESNSPKKSDFPNETRMPEPIPHEPLTSERENEDQHEREYISDAGDAKSEEIFWEVKRIEGKKKSNGDWYYKVIWTDDSYTWEPLSNLQNCPLAIREFETTMRRKRSRRSQREEQQETHDAVVQQRPQLRLLRSRAGRLPSDSEQDGSLSPVSTRRPPRAASADLDSDSTEDTAAALHVSATAEPQQSQPPRTVRATSPDSIRLEELFATPPHPAKCYACARGPPPSDAARIHRKPRGKQKGAKLKEVSSSDDFEDDFDNEYSEETLNFCSNCTNSVHESCLPISAPSKKRPRLSEYLTDGALVCVKCRDSITCSVCAAGSTPAAEDAPPAPYPTSTWYRCVLCQVAGHWACMSRKIMETYDKMTLEDEEDDPPYTLQEALCEMATTFRCATCLAYTHGVERVLTYRTAPHESEYLVKFKDMSYRKLAWVSEAWLRGTHVYHFRSFQRVLHDDPAAWPKSEEDVVPAQWRRVDRILDIANNKYLVKWMGRPHSELTWESNLDPATDPDVARALACYEQAQNLGSEISERKARAKLNDARPDPKAFELLKEQPAGLVGGTLKPYQLDGLNWLLGNWCARTPCILADEMGLGKTIQVIAFLVHLFQAYSRFPFLLVVPNSTLDNWNRELSTWAPQLFVVTSTGTREERKMIHKYDIFKAPHSKSLKCHIVLTSYESVLLTSAFRNVQWDVLIVDEGHRLKNDKSKLFTFLKEFKVAHKLLLTGTPLQNNIRELFNLMHFMDPEHFQDPEQLASTYNMENSAEAKNKIDELHTLLRPHFLRRVKSDVLKDLPPKAEILVPVRMSQLQRELIKDIYSSNFELLKALGKNAAMAKNTKSHLLRSSSLLNILMQCRKVLSHPFLLPEVEEGLGALSEPEAIHRRMVESGGKLVLLSQMLPKLKEHGHKVLIFAQFKTTLDILEDFLTGCEWEYFRFDGDTARTLRQEYIDAFNASPNKFVFLLSTRAGGVGLNLTSADTVIIYDADWNPHQDVQAIARCHRIGQSRPVLAFKLMTVASVEEKMVSVGMKKMALDHIVVQKMKESTINEHDLMEVLRFGVQALFEEDTSQVQKYSDEDVDRLLDRAQAKPYLASAGSSSASSPMSNGGSGGSGSDFGFAKVWLEKRVDGPVLETPEEEWDELLKKLRKDTSEAVEVQGRRKRKAVNYATLLSPLKRKTLGNKPDEVLPPSDSEVSIRSLNDEDSESTSVIDEHELNAELSDLLNLPLKKGHPIPRAPHSDPQLPSAPQAPLPPPSQAQEQAQIQAQPPLPSTTSSASLLEEQPSKHPVWRKSYKYKDSELHHTVITPSLSKKLTSKGKPTGATVNTTQTAAPADHSPPHPFKSPIPQPAASASAPSSSTATSSPYYAYLLPPPPPDRIPRSPGGQTASTFANQSPCWICAGSIYSGVSYHLPIQCPALHDRDFLIKRLRTFYTYAPHASRPAQVFLQKMIQRSEAYACLICQSTAHHDVTYCPLNRNLRALLVARDRIVATRQKNTSWTEDLGKVEMFVRLLMNEREQQMHPHSHLHSYSHSQSQSQSQSQSHPQIQHHQQTQQHHQQMQYYQQLQQQQQIQQQHHHHHYQHQQQQQQQ